MVHLYTMTYIIHLCVCVYMYGYVLVSIYNVNNNNSDNRKKENLLYSGLCCPGRLQSENQKVK